MKPGVEPGGAASTSTHEGASGSERPGRPSFVRSALYMYGTNIAVATLSLLNVLVIARALGPDGRGDVTFLTTITLLTASLATLGIHQASANLAARQPELRPAIASNALVFSLVLGAVSAGVVAILIVLVPAVGGGESTALRWVALGAIPLMILRTYVGMIVQAEYAFSISNVGWLVGPVVNIGVNGIMAWMGVMTVGSAVAAWIAGQALGVALLTGYIGRRMAGFGRPDLRLAWDELRFGIKAHAGNVMLIGNYRLDQWILGAISGAYELGLYSVAVAWGEALFFLPTALASVLRPDVARDSPAESARRTAAVFRVSTLATVPLAVGMVLLAPFLCVTIFGEEFRGSIDDLRWLIPGGFGILALKILGSTLTAQGRPLLETAAIGIAFVSTLTLDILLIPPYGGLGAAIASSAAYLIGGAAVILIFLRGLHGRPADMLPRRTDLAVLRRRR